MEFVKINYKDSNGIYKAQQERKSKHCATNK